MTRPGDDMEPVEIPATADVRTLHAYLSHTDHEWALREPHKAMQIHIGCQLGDCIAKSIAWGELVRTGAIVPDSNRSMRGKP